MPAFTLSTVVPRPFAETLASVRPALADEGFGVLTEIDLRATMRATLDVEVAPQVVLGACRPALAHAALQVDPSIAALLPCNVVVRALDDTTTVVEAFDPDTMAAFALDGRLDEVAADARARLVRVLEAVEVV